MKETTAASSNLFRKVTGALAVATFASIAATTALAGPDKIDILGIIPGESGLSEIKQASIDPNKDVKDGRFELAIGGQKITCSTDFRNGKLNFMVCPTGAGTPDWLKFTELSNIEMHSLLARGFAEKLGKPDSVESEVLRNRLGAQYDQNIVVWVDKQGNMLRLISRFQTPNSGILIVESSEELKDQAAKKAAKEFPKKF